MMHAIKQARRYGDQIAHLNNQKKHREALKIVNASIAYRAQFVGTEFEQKVEAAFLAGLMSS